MAVAERIGQIGTFAMPFFYRLSRPVGTVAMTSLATMVVTVTIYYACWVRYVRRGREYGLLFAPLGPLPLPMALLPMAYFVAMSAFLSSPYLLTAALLFAAGHVYMSKQELARSRATSQP